MRFSLPFVAAAALFGLATAKPTLESRQIEASKFGVLTIAPYNQTLKLGRPFTVNYNSTLAFWQPLTLDVYIQGTYPNNFVTPYFQLLRTDYPADAHFYSFNTTLPVIANDDTDGYLADAGYTLSAWITFTTDTGAISRGGLLYGVQIELD